MSPAPPHNSKLPRLTWVLSNSALQAIFLMGLLPYPPIQAQELMTLSGKVVDQLSGMPVENANVVLVGTGLGDATDANGVFVINGLAPRNYRLRITHIGYREFEREIMVPFEGELNVPIEETFFQLQEIVVTGTRTQKIHRDVPVATEVVSRKDIMDSGARDVAELLEERILQGAIYRVQFAGGSF